jgi:hypothetical protein
MGLALVTSLAFCLWVVLWAIGVKGFDSFLITILMLIIAGAAHVLMPFLPGNQRSPD